MLDFTLYCVVDCRKHSDKQTEREECARRRTEESNAELFAVYDTSGQFVAHDVACGVHKGLSRPNVCAEHTAERQQLAETSHKSQRKGESNTHKQTVKSRIQHGVVRSKTFGTTEDDAVDDD